MKRFFYLLAATAMTSAAHAQNPGSSDSDSLKIHHLQQIEVTATRATATTPVAYADIRKSELEKATYGTDIPSVLALTPSVVATNETGIGIGGTSIRLRGTDATRLNVTVNGVSINNPDSHAVYWYDTPDLISSVGSIQVQRGAGISTNGTGAFGGAINMTTDALTTKFGGEASLSYGSFNTQKQAVRISSGLLGGHWSIDARLSHISSDGYIDRGATDLKSYMFQAGYYHGSTMLKLLSYGGKARTALTYTGVTKEEMELNGRRFNSEGMYFSDSGNHGYYYMDEGKVQRATVGYYDDQTDNYTQINNQLVLSHRFNNRWALNATAFYTYGYGFYRQYKEDRTLAEYLNLDTTIAEADLIREKVMRNHLGGLHAAAAYTTQNLDLTFGGSWSLYTCPHWGELLWVEGMDKEDIGGRWYDNDAEKLDANIFARASWQVAGGLRLFADMQYRHVGYKADGVNDNAIWSDDGVTMQPIDVDRRYHFFNPHIGLSYTLGHRNNFYASFSIANKEPTRNDFTDRYMFAADGAYPRPERLYDWEVGYTYRAPRLTLGVNLYYMLYRDQLVPTGRINDGYDSINDNVERSYRRGVEIEASWRALDWFTVGANATLSQNRIDNYIHRVVDYAIEGDVAGAYGYREVEMGTTTLAYSPSTVASLFLNFHHRGFGARLHTQYVGRQYFTNYENDAMALDPYCVTNLNLTYALQTRTARNVIFGVMINNLFNARYESNGYGWSEAYEGEQSDHAYYFPQAPTNVLANITVKF